MGTTLQTRGVYALVAAVGFLSAAGCATSDGLLPSEEVAARPVQDVARAYADALEAGRLDDAFALTAHAGQGPGAKQAFRARYADPAVRGARAREIRAALDALRVDGPGLSMVQQDGWRIVESADATAAAQTLRTFLDAADRGDFTTAYALLAAPLRARYTAQTLARDFAQEPLARERLARARLALERPPLLRADGVDFPIGDGKAVRLIREGREHRVAALE